MTGFGETLKIVHYEAVYMVTKLYRINAYHPDNWLINDVENINDALALKRTICVILKIRYNNMR